MTCQMTSAFLESNKKGEESVLFFGIYEPSLLSLFDRMFIDRRVFVSSVSVSM